MKTFFVIIFVMISAFIKASQIEQIALSTLAEKADLIVLAEVVDVIRSGDQDRVRIMIGHYLKGNSADNELEFTLISRGGLKDFDPALESGQTGVFFLTYNELNGRFEKAYWGSVAVFQKSNFILNSHRIKSGEK